MKKSNLYKVILAFILLLSACTNSTLNQEKDFKEFMNQQEEEQINHDDPLAFLDTLTEIKVVYENGNMLVIDNEDYIKRFKDVISVAMTKQEKKTNRTDFGSIICTAYFGDHILTFAEIFGIPAIDGNYWAIDDSTVMEIFYAQCLENGKEFIKLNRTTYVDSIYDFFELNSTEREYGVISLKEIKGIAYGFYAIEPIYDFNKNIYIYNFYNREKMQFDAIQYDWVSKVATLDTCKYTENNQSFNNCSDFEIAWMYKMLNSFLVNIDGKYINYSTFIEQVDEFYRTTWLYEGDYK